MHPVEVASLLERGSSNPDHVGAAAVLHEILEGTVVQRTNGRGSWKVPQRACVRPGTG
jgi:hypothetical protein